MLLFIGCWPLPSRRWPHKPGAKLGLQDWRPLMNTHFMGIPSSQAIRWCRRRWLWQWSLTQRSFSQIIRIHCCQSWVCGKIYCSIMLCRHFKTVCVTWPSICFNRTSTSSHCKFAILDSLLVHVFTSFNAMSTYLWDFLLQKRAQVF